ncbi:tyrosine-protein phosphatase [Belliella marina]|uniref:Tyrosine-protein phosphatase n=1 Tax=Belliella marina TaxID=1644146 RepID=A0ABW4VHZ0_9BACT
MKITILAILTSFISIVAFGQKNAEIQSSPNFRELGGLEISPNSKIKDGVIYRSGSFSDLNTEDAKTFEKTGIKTIVDFRSEHEIAKEPDHLPENMEIDWVNAPIGNINPEKMGKFAEVLMSPDFDEAAVEGLMVDVNKGFIDNIADFKPLFDVLLDKEHAILFHCTAGKDRTGLASSLFLHALGADWDTIMEDFLLSNEAVDKLDKKKSNAYGLPQDRIDMLMGVRASYLESAWDTAIKKYGSIDTMLEKELGIGKNEKAKLQKKFLVVR